MTTRHGIVAWTVGLALVAMSGQAHAQAYLSEPGLEPYAALEAEEGTTLFTDTDDGFVEVTLPFAFRFYGRPYTSVWVSANGGVSFVARDPVTSVVSALPGENVALPSIAPPQAIIAVVWDDWVASSLAPDGGSRVAWGVRGEEGDRRVIVDWQRMQPFGASGAELPAFSFQLRLHETTDRYEVRFGPVVGEGDLALTATSGAENHQGGAGFGHLDCSPTCGVGELAPGTGVVLSPNLNPELEAYVNVVGAFDGGPRAEVRVANTGPTAATGVGFKVLLSADPLRDDLEDEVIYVHPEPFGVGPRPGAVTFTLDLPVDPALSGAHHLIVVVDPEGVVPELNKLNNVAVSSPFIAGAELTAVMTTLPEAIVGEYTSVNVELSNLGVRAASGVVCHLVIDGPLLDAPVVLHESEPVELPGLSSRFTQALPVLVPNTFLGGRYALYVVIDPDDLVVESDELNNTGDWQAFDLHGPDVAITAIEADATSAFVGRTMPVRVELNNKGIARASDFTFSVYLSPNDVITLRDERIYTSQRITLEGRTSRSILEAAHIPADVEPGEYYVGVIVDAEGLLLETDRGNNIRRTEGTLTVTAPIADLTVSDVATVTAAPAGEPVPVSAVVSNLGAADTEFAWAVVLSSNEIVSPLDRRLIEGRSSVAAGKQRSLSLDVRLPPSLSPGQYTVGVLVDPDDEVPEVNEANNGAAAPARLTVSAPALSIVTSHLPEAISGLPYAVELRAVGVTSEPSWRLAGGELPEGLALTASGRIAGTPTTPGLHVVVVEVSSAGATAMETFVLPVRSFAASLGLSDTRLPPARRGVPYRQQLGVEGGTPPYVFTLSGEAPPGLSMDEQGVVSGLALEEGSYQLSVQVVDAAGHRKSGVVSLDVVAVGTLTLVANRLRDPESGRPYVQPLVIEGGQPPYEVSVVEGALPDGLSVRVGADGSVASLEGTPSRTGAWSFTLQVTDARGDRDYLHAVMRVTARALSFVDLSLPDTSPGAEYEYQFETNARPPATFTLAGGALPSGLSMDENGLISGTVDVEVPRRVHAFAVHVVDSTGGVGLAAFAIDVPAPRRTTAAKGCASSGGAGALSLVALLVLFARGARRQAAAFATLLTILSAGDAFAYYRVERQTAPFVPLATSTTLSDSSSADPLNQSSPVSLPFPFSFYGKAQTSIGVGINGLLTFGSVNASKNNTPLPSSGEPSNFIAPFWDDLQLSKNTPNGPSRTSYAVEGEAPHRVLVVEWKNVQRESPVQSGVEWEAYSFQVRLHETTNEVSIHTTVHATAKTLRAELSGTVGIENDTGARATDLSDQRCSPDCGFGAIVHNRLVTLVPAADLRFQSVTAPPTFHWGSEVLLRASLLNEGGAEARDTRVTYLLSTDTLPSDDDRVLAKSVPVTVAAASPSSVSTRVTIDDTLPPGIYQLLARVETSAEEVTVENNRSEPLQIVVTPAAADFVVTRLLGTPTSRPGAAYEYTRTLKNQGNETGTGEFVVVLSSNDHASLADLELERGTFTLAPGASLDETRTVTLPSSLVPGAYWLGLLVRSTQGATETDSLNNARTLGPITLEGGELSIVETELPEVVAGVPFAFDLHATGGAGGYQWSVGTPSLPAGVRLSPSGTLSGVIDANGDFPVRIQLHSAGSIVSRLFTLASVREHSPVSIVTSRLPVGAFATPYQASLVARGGTPPYAWSVDGNSAPPAGLSLASDGTLEGHPGVDGDALFRVVVTDAEGASASGQIVVPLAGPVRPLFAAAGLPAGLVGEEYDFGLVGVGGAPPYAFTVVETRRLATAAGDEARTFVGGLPAGLTLEEDGRLAGRPTAAGLYALSFRLVDAQANEDTATFVLTVKSDRALSILTSSLPDATVGVRYEAALSSTGAADEISWELELLDGVSLPGGLSLMPDGRIVGLPLVSGHAAFLAIARDRSGHFAARPLAVRVVEAPREASPEGCSQAGAAGLLSLLALGACWTRRRRAGGLMVLMAALGLSATTACTRTPASACAEACGEGFVCDALDGLCKCGVAGGAVCAPGERCDSASRSCLVATCDTGCPPGTRCGDDGACHCGLASGPVCEPGESCSDLARCEAVDPCRGVICSAGSVCDPEAGGECRCGEDGLVCAPGERCVDSACLPDHCVGVACTGGTACDPADGQCRCGGAGGALCLSGETCDAVRGACERSDACAGVQCPAGSPCDPTDGLCRCGGPGGPVCGGDQTCDPLSQLCEGGDLCRTVICTNGTSCDPEDGACKCGGLGGIACGPNELCVSDGARHACEQTCDLSVQGCPSGSTCRFDETAKALICKPEGVSVRGEACGVDEPCAPGLHCVKTGATNAARCRDYCTTSDECAGNVVCQPFLPDGPLGACLVEGQ